MLWTSRTDNRTWLRKLFFTEEGEVNRRNLFLILVLLVLIGNLDRLFD
jgi:hypothetical protein